MTFSGTIEKTPGDRVWLAFDFGDLPELRDSAVTIAAVDIPAVSGIAIASVQLEDNGYRVGAWFSGGTDGSDYDVTCEITLSDTTEIARTGTLRVSEKSE